ncbi:uncharacterized protein LOC117173150 [Belonocnema kinseyi]|uniref:uncharacterized protein LOC117173150 n=1 Tax=Belonocnema kinseyi TaxID=2817044 RepID=UPI00143DEFD7|nr:uncharacterized protein LOC117173150 [Belonocnema kinseyi]XP_033217443.1 uncharacterized protein LOC117173150 [Belonocnema kinseyi]
MQIHAGAPLLTLAIYFHFSELSLQYNTTALQEGDRTLPDNMNIYYTLTTQTRVEVKDGFNLAAHGFIDPDDNAMVCLIEQAGSIRLARALYVNKTRMRVYDDAFRPLSSVDIIRYQLHFDHDVNS